MDKNTIKTNQAQADCLFEVSWEACNKVGGIYTVLQSKAKQMISHYDQQYFLIGPYFPEKIKGSFLEKAPPQCLKTAFTEMGKHGIKCHFGTWLIPEEPNIILIDFKDFWPRIDHIKTELWEEYKIDSLNSGHAFNEPVVWGYAVGMLLEKIHSTCKKKNVVAHFHEWLSASGLLYLKKNQIKIGTVFTTHATTLGRTLSFNNIDFYSILNKIDPGKEVVKYNVKDKHQLETQAAQNCDVLTTVSEITSMEAERFLGRKPDILLLNGLDLEKYLTFEEITIKHRIQRDRLREFLLFYFFPYYTFDLKNTLFYFIVGRYEFRTKGIDIFIKSLAELNKKLIKSKSNKTIVTFFWIPTATKGINPEILESRELFQDIKDSLEEVSQETKEKILYATVEGKGITKETLFEKDFIFGIKKKLLKLKRKGLPPLSTHLLADPQDPILKSLNEAGLTNKKSDKVKVVSYPIYLTGHDGLSNLDYQESIQACHLGVLPSFYEPWGYTPLETAALGVASVTTDLAGFGRYCQQLDINKKQFGIFTLERFNKTDEEEIQALSKFLYRFSRFSRKERVQNKMQARRIAARTDWKFFAENYIKAHNLAISKIKDQ